MASRSPLLTFPDSHNQGQDPSRFSNGNDSGTQHGGIPQRYLSSTTRKRVQLEKENAQLNDIAMRYKQLIKTVESSSKEELSMRKRVRLEKETAQLKDIAMRYKQLIKTMVSGVACSKEELAAQEEESAKLKAMVEKVNLERESARLEDRAMKYEQMIKILESSVASLKEELVMLHQRLLNAELEHIEQLMKELASFQGVSIDQVLEKSKDDDKMRKRIKK